MPSSAQSLGPVAVVLSVTLGLIWLVTGSI